MHRDMVNRPLSKSGKEGVEMHRCNCELVVEESDKLGVECREDELVESGKLVLECKEGELVVEGMSICMASLVVVESGSRA